MVVFFLFLTIVTLCGLLQLQYFQNIWSGYMPGLSAICVMMLSYFGKVLSVSRHCSSLQDFKSSCTSEHIHVFQGHYWICWKEHYHLFIPRICTTYGQKSLFYRGAVAWNNIDHTLYLVTQGRIQDGAFGENAPPF